VSGFLSRRIIGGKRKLQRRIRALFDYATIELGREIMIAEHDHPVISK